MTEIDMCKLPYAITTDLLENCLLNGHKNKSQFVLTSFTCRKASNEGTGFLSDIYRLSLNWKNPDKEAPSSVILKIRSNRGMTESGTLKNCDAKTMTLFKESLENVHKIECTFYANFGNSVPLPVPKCYRTFLDDTDGTGYLLMADLAGCQEISPYDGFSSDHLNEIVDHLARLHCWCLSEKSADWKSHFSHYYDFPSWFEYLHRLTFDTLDNLCKSYPTHFQKIDKSIVDKAFDKSLIEVREGQGVLAHGDLWIHNILFDPARGKIAGFIDWQFANVGNLVDDLARLMIYSVRTDVRRENEIQILKRYHENLKIGLSSDKKEIDFLPDFESLLKMYRRRFAFEAISVVCDFSLLIEECLQRTGVEGHTKQKDLEELLCRGSATLSDAESLLKAILDK